MSESTKPQKSALHLRPDEKQIAPAVKAWLDNVIVPALVKQWLAEGRNVTAAPSGAKAHDAESKAVKLR